MCYNIISKGMTSFPFHPPCGFLSARGVRNGRLLAYGEIMIKITGNTIEMTRGDTLTATITILDGSGQAYVPVEQDVIRFAVKHADMTLGRKAYKDANPLINKTIPNDTLVLQLNPADTKQLDFGAYDYDIELTHADGAVDTFISGRFVLEPEVH